MNTLTSVFGYPFDGWTNAWNVKILAIHIVALLLPGIRSAQGAGMGVASTILLSASNTILATIRWHGIVAFTSRFLHATAAS